MSAVIQNCFAVVPAAGESRRLGSDASKILIPIKKKTTVLDMVIDKLVQSRFFSGIVIPVRAEDIDELQPLVRDYAKKCPISFVSGGETRQQSVWRALSELKGRAETVLIHDAARPLCSVRDISAVGQMSVEKGAAILARPLTSTLKKVDPKIETVLETVSRESLWLAQTPQGFSFDIIYHAHAKAIEDNYVATDDSELVERLGRTVTIVPASSCNVKITTAEDLDLVKALLNTRP